MILFHGSKNGIKGEIEPISRKECDFGQGFYMGESKHICEAWVSDFKYKEPAIYKVECDFKNLKGHSFEINRDWYLYIAYNRIPEKISRYKNVVNYLKKYDEYDWLSGVIADDRLIYSLNEFFTNQINEIALTSCLNVFNYGVQFVAKTKAACKCIKILDSELLSNDTRNANNNEVQHRLESIKDVVEQVKTRYRKSDSKFFDEILEEM